jgi:lysophospholipase L1-like esterase
MGLLLTTLHYIITAVYSIMPLHHPHSILLFGDSITQQGWGVDGEAGWVAMLADAYVRRAEVLNRGYSGYTTRHALQILPSMLPLPESVLFCTVHLGANDAALPESLQHVPTEEYATNLQKMITSIRSHEGSTCPIILLTPPPIDAERWRQVFDDPKPNRTNESSRDYGNVVKEVAAAQSCLVLDVFTLLGGNGNCEDYTKNLRDGLHLSGSGNVLLFEGLSRLIHEEFPELAPMVNGEGKYGDSGIPQEGLVWSDICAQK